MVTSRATTLCHRTEKHMLTWVPESWNFPHGEMMREKARNSRSWCGCCFFLQNDIWGMGQGIRGLLQGQGVDFGKGFHPLFHHAPSCWWDQSWLQGKNRRCLLLDLGLVRELVWCGFRVGISASRWTGVNQKRGRTSACGPDPHHSAGKVCVYVCVFVGGGVGWGVVVLIGSPP